MNGFPLLSLLVWLPSLGALSLLAPMSATIARRVAVGWSLLVFLLSLLLIPGLGSFNLVEPGLQFREQVAWVPSIGIEYFVGIDGISIWLVILTTFLTPLALLAAFDSITTRVRSFLAFMLLLETGMLGVFVAQDLFLFYIFWEWTLVPSYFLIGIWGGPQRIYATIKFFLYTLAGSVFMLLAIIALYVLYGKNSFNLPDMVRDLHNGAFVLDPTLARWLFAGFFIAFAIKVPIWPFHSWQQDAYAEAPTPVTVLLAAVLVKLGSYGFIRFNLQLFPEATQYFAPAIGVLAVISIIYGGIAAFAQRDLKRMIAYSSISHLGFVMLGIFSLRPEGLHGAILQMVNHGISTGALFLIIGFLYERRNTRDIDAFGGLWKVMPIFSYLTLVVVMSSLGLPGLNGFIGESTILFGTLRSPLLGWVFAAFAVIGLILAVIYLLWLFRKVMMGDVTDATARLRDATGRELVILTPLVALIFLIGLYPLPFFVTMESSVSALIQQFGPLVALR